MSAIDGVTVRDEGDTVDTWFRRARGMLLRVTHSRTTALVAGLVLLAPATMVAVGDYGWESWVTSGLGLVVGATGAALVLTGFAGRRPDWIDPDEPIDR